MLEQLLLLRLVGPVYDLHGLGKILCLKFPHPLRIHDPSLLLLIISPFLLNLLQNDALLGLVNGLSLRGVRSIATDWNLMLEWDLAAVVDSFDLQ